MVRVKVRLEDAMLLVLKMERKGPRAKGSRRRPEAGKGKETDLP